MALGLGAEAVVAGLEEGVHDKPLEVRLSWIIAVSTGTSGKVALQERENRQIRDAIDALEETGKGGKYEECANVLKRLLEEAPPSEDPEAEDEPGGDPPTA